jgi:hypothetical protein
MIEIEDSITISANAKYWEFKNKRPRLGKYLSQKKQDKTGFPA